MNFPTPEERSVDIDIFFKNHHDAPQAKVLRAAHMLAMHLAAGEPVREATLELRDCAVALLRISVMNPKFKRGRSTVQHVGCYPCVLPRTYYH